MRKVVYMRNINHDGNNYELIRDSWNRLHSITQRFMDIEKSLQKEISNRKMTNPTNKNR